RAIKISETTCPSPKRPSRRTSTAFSASWASPIELRPLLRRFSAGSSNCRKYNDPNLTLDNLACFIAGGIFQNGRVAAGNRKRTESYHSGPRPGGEGTYRDGVSNRLRNNGREG